MLSATFHAAAIFVSLPLQTQRKCVREVIVLNIQETEETMAHLNFRPGTRVLDVASRLLILSIWFQPGKRRLSPSDT
jgi:hypothetical protein